MNLTNNLISGTYIYKQNELDERKVRLFLQVHNYICV